MNKNQMKQHKIPVSRVFHLPKPTGFVENDLVEEKKLGFLAMLPSIGETARWSGLSLEMEVKESSDHAGSFNYY